MGLGTLLIRADASPEIGTGHVMRCLALAQSWSDQGGRALFAMAESTPAIRERMTAEHFEVLEIAGPPGGEQDWESLRRCAEAQGASWIVVDGYRNSETYCASLRTSDARLLLVDDFAEQSYSSADVILNSNLGASEALYPGCRSRSKLLLGLDYVLLRREFSSWRKWHRAVDCTEPEILVTMGGSDPSGVASRILEGGRITGHHMSVVVGGSARASPTAGGHCGIEILGNRHEMASVMAKADIVVICAGGTLWESLFMECATLSYARNDLQQEILERLQERNAVRYLGRIEAFNREHLLKLVDELSSRSVRAQMAQAARELVDGCGAERVVQAMRDF